MTCWEQSLKFPSEIFPKNLVPKDFFKFGKSLKSFGSFFLISIIATKHLELPLLDDYYNYYSTADDSIFFKKRKKLQIHKKIFKKATTK